MPATKKATKKSIKKATKKATKKIVEKTENKIVEKTEKKAKEKKERSLGATGRVCELLIERAYSDEDIIKIIQAEFPDRTVKQIKVYISCQRADINAGRKKQFVVDELLVRLVKEDGELKPYTPKTKTKTKKEKAHTNQKRSNLLNDYIKSDEDENEE